MADIPHPIVPTLQGGSRNILKSRESVAAYLIYFMFTNPGDISNTFTDLLSFRGMVARNDQNPEELVAEMQSSVQNAMDTCFPDDGIQVTARYQTGEGDTFGVEFNIVDGSGTPILTNKNIQLAKDGISINT